MDKKAVLAIVAVLLVSTVVLATTDADADSQGFSGGTGTASDPFLISNEDQLQYVAATATNSNNHYLLISDIQLSGEWMPIGSNGGPFRGTIDGNGHTVSNLTINSSLSEVGFISNNEGTVKNLFFSSANVTSTGLEAYVGVVVGNNIGTIENCLVTASTVTAGSTFKDVVSDQRVGGIVGLNRGTVSACECADVTVTVQNTMRDSISTGNNQSHPSVQNNVYAGGIAGYSTHTVTNCLTDADIVVDVVSRYVGSVIMVGGFEPIMNVYGGGIVGYNDGTLSNSANVNSDGLSFSYVADGKNFWNTPSSYLYCASGNGAITGHGDNAGCATCLSDIGFIPESAYTTWDYSSNVNESGSPWYINNSIPHLVHPYLRVDNTPSKTVYEVGEEFSAEGMVVSIHNANGGREVATYDSVNHRFSDDGTTISLVVSSGSNSTYITYDVDIEPEWMVLSNPTKTTYYPGETFDTTGMRIGYRMSENSSFIEFTDYTISPSVITENTTSVTVTCGNWSTSFSINVIEPPVNTYRVDFRDPVLGDYTEYYNGGQILTFKALSSDGSTFIGWNTASDGSGTSYAAGTTYTVVGDVTFYAIWEDDSAGDGGDSGDEGAGDEGSGDGGAGDGDSGEEDSGGWCSLTMLAAFVAIFAAVIVPIALIRW